MFKHQQRVSRMANIFADSVIVAAAMIATFFIRNYISPYIHLAYELTIEDYFRALIFIIPLVNFFLYMNGLYPTNRLRPLRAVVWMIVKANVGCAVACVIVLYAVKMYVPGRIAIVLFTFINSVMLVVKEFMMRKILKAARRNGIGIRNLLILGDHEIIPKIIEEVKRDPFLGLNVAAVYLLDVPAEGKVFGQARVFDTRRDIRRVLLENHIDNVVIAVSKENLSETEELLLKCEEFGAEIWLYADFFELMFAQKEIDTLGDMPLLIFRTTPQPSLALIFKRVMDIVGSLVLMVLVAPLVLFSAAVIKLTSPGPVIFKQWRVGLHGRKFLFYKMRTMVTDAEQRRQELVGRNIMSGPVFKLKDDPRVTAFGRFLRRSSIDELPQLWNVLKGEMSLVGPRPPLSREVLAYRGWQRRRLSMRPGLTCLWQIQGRSNITDFNKWAKLDLQYIDNWSLWLDFVILVKTVFVVLFRIGAE